MNLVEISDYLHEKLVQIFITGELLVIRLHGGFWRGLAKAAPKVVACARCVARRDYAGAMEVWQVGSGF